MWQYKEISQGWQMHVQFIAEKMQGKCRENAGYIEGAFVWADNQSYIKIH